MALRVLVYTGLLYQHLVRENRLTPNGKLPPVFPLVLYNGDTRWNAVQDMKSLIDLPSGTPLWPYQPKIRYYLLDESRYPDGKAGSLNPPSDFEDFSEVQIMLATRMKQWEQELIEQTMTKGIEQGIERGIEQGIERGIEQGIERGVLTGETTLLRRQLQLRFGALPTWVSDRLAQANRDSLEQWGLKVLDAKTLDEIFG